MTNLIKKDGLYIREGTYDARTLGECRRSYGWLDLRGKRVLDVGACFGSFTVHALRSGAKHVVAMEPDPGNYKLLLKNVSDWMNVTTANYAISTCAAAKIPLYKTTGTSHGNYSTTPFRGRVQIEVRNTKFSRVLAWNRPSVIKIDCEGCEYDLLLNHGLPRYVKQIALEIHLNKKEWREKWFKMLDFFADWECVKEPYDTGKNWATVGGWRR